MSVATVGACWSRLIHVPSREAVIRHAATDDAGAIGVIYDEAIATGTATFAEGLHDEGERAEWLAARGKRAPVWVLELAHMWDD